MTAAPRLAASRRLLAYACAALAAMAVAGLGALSTDLGPWYASLRQPPWKPADMWFGPAWTLIFALTALAGVQAWLHSRDAAERQTVLAVFALNGFLNLMWSLLFFRLRRPDWALLEVGLLWLSIVLLIVVVARRAGAAAWLLAPYLAWVSFAAALNLAVARLNGYLG